MFLGGAVVRLDSDIVGQNGSTGTGSAASPALQWESAEYDDKWQDLYKFWLGPDLTFTADASTNELTATAHATITGDGPLRVTSSGTLPAPLVVDTDYWIINDGTNTLRLASSFVNALAGTAIDLTTAGTGTHTLRRASRLVVPGSGIQRISLHAATGLVGSFSGSFATQIRDADGNLFRYSSSDGGSAGFNNVSSSIGTIPFDPSTVTGGTGFNFRHAASDTDYDIDAETTYFGIAVWQGSS